ncbi:e7948746-6a94-4d45-8773-0ee44f9a9d14-CDS [Sclerotinia trifoliorum]|uniref:E7948746-6a94-4d45-8773-0ee44f9a9d14-CDS n=1 Tax=Sclerotinia trifoliorum TaxID=28548 RepID=A0A8H2VTQ1_9HELO|nr:e7948746-6a94-4d45-8773-0ee44f9a9d14-CDS [Sclerotinia trifoliorum]
MSSSKEPEPEPTFQLFTSLRYDPILLQSPLNIQSWPLPSPTPCPFYMLPYHRDRLQQAATHFSWPIAINAISGPDGFQNLLTTLSKTIDTSSPTPLRVRVVLDHRGNLTVESNPVPAVSLSNLFPTRLPPPSTLSHPTPQASISPLTGGALTLGTTDLLPSEPLKSFNSSTPYTIIPDPSLTTPSPYTSFKTTSRTMYDTARSRAQIHTFTEPKEVLLVSPNGEIMEGSLTTPFFYRDGKWVTPSEGCGGQIGTTRRWALEKGISTQSTISIDSLTEDEECWISNGVRGFTFGKIKLLP